MHFANGTDLIGTVTSETCLTVQLQIQLAGVCYVRREQEGLANLTASMMEEGSDETNGWRELQAA